jgi:hypothetical protein
MRELSSNELNFVSGGDYEDWQVVAIAAASSGIAFGAIEAYHAWSLLTGLKFMAVCSIPTAIVSGAIVGGVELFYWINS